MNWTIGKAVYSFVAGSFVTGGAGDTIILKAVDNGLLTFDLEEMDLYTENTYKTFKVKIESTNYEDFELEITIVRSECEHPDSQVEFVVDQEATCTQEGYGHMHCNQCGTDTVTGSSNGTENGNGGGNEAAETSDLNMVWILVMCLVTGVVGSAAAGRGKKKAAK